jgi:hypothetical protein
MAFVLLIRREQISRLPNQTETGPKGWVEFRCARHISSLRAGIQCANIHKPEFLGPIFSNARVALACAIRSYISKQVSHSQLGQVRPILTMAVAILYLG